MALIIEDGSLVVGANSYVTVAEARAFAEARASSLPVDNAAVEAAAVRAMDFLESFRAKYQGTKVSSAQALQWPREGATLDGFDIPTDSIPQVLKDAQCVLIVETAAGTDLQPTGDGREVIREKVDVLETEYSAGSGGAPQPVFTKAFAMLAPLFSTGGLGLLRATRG